MQISKLKRREEKSSYVDWDEFAQNDPEAAFNIKSMLDKKRAEIFAKNGITEQNMLTESNEASRNVRKTIGLKRRFALVEATQDASAADGKTESERFNQAIDDLFPKKKVPVKLTEPEQM